MTYNNLLRGLAAGTLALTATLGLAACGEYRAPGELGELQRLLETCPTGQKLATLVEWDGTGSGRSPQTDADRLRILEEVVRKTAVCGGTLTVSVFSAGSAATVPLYDGDLELPGATDNARLRRVPESVEFIMEQIEDAYGDAIASLPARGTDINGLYRLAGERRAQLGSDYQLNFVILTDGLNNLSGTVLDAGVLTPEQAVALADQVSVPSLPGASITVAGLGRIAGSGAAPSELVEGLVAYYDRLCENTGAASCLSVTDRR